MRGCIRNELYSCFIFGEAGGDRKFLLRLTEEKKFKYHTAKWSFNYSNGSGGSPDCVLKKCNRESAFPSFDLILCFVDLDKLKHDFPNSWEEEKTALEDKYPSITIIWYEDNAEDVYKKVLGKKAVGLSKRRINALARKEVGQFINSPLWKKIIDIISKKEQQLNNKKR